MKKPIEKILIVDDEADICFLIKSVLKRQSDAEIDICNSVAKATERLNENIYDLAFFDMRLNDGTGEELVNHVHSNTRQNPFIAIISAYTSEEDLEKLYSLKINRFIAKPLTSSEIINCYQVASA